MPAESQLFDEHMRANLDAAVERWHATDPELLSPAARLLVGWKQEPCPHCSGSGKTWVKGSPK